MARRACRTGQKAGRPLNIQSTAGTRNRGWPQGGRSPMARLLQTCRLGGTGSIAAGRKGCLHFVFPPAHEPEPYNTHSVHRRSVKGQRRTGRLDLGCAARPAEFIRGTKGVAERTFQEVPLDIRGWQLHPGPTNITQAEDKTMREMTQ